MREEAISGLLHGYAAGHGGGTATPPMPGRGGGCLQWLVAERS